MTLRITSLQNYLSLMPCHQYNDNRDKITRAQRISQFGTPEKKIKLNLFDLNLEKSSSTQSPSPKLDDEQKFESMDFQNLDQSQLDGPIFRLPTFNSNAVQYITSETLNNEIDNPDLILYDCRYSYEFEGGHIDRAVHLDQQSNLHEKLFSSASKTTKIVVLYCEFSLKRSVEKYLEIRRIDRSLNHYPNLFYDNLYVLDKGFSNFFEQYQVNCVGKYIKMNDPMYENQMEEEMNKNRTRKIQRKNTLTIKEFKNLQFKL